MTKVSNVIYSLLYCRKPYVYYYNTEIPVSSF